MAQIAPPPPPVTTKAYLLAVPAFEQGGLVDFMADMDLIGKGVCSDDCATDGERIAEMMGRLDYMSFDPTKRRPGGAAAYFARILSERHTNIIEIPHYVWIVRCSQGIGREVLRYRTAERSQTSTRYVAYEDMPMIWDPDDPTPDESWRQVYREKLMMYDQKAPKRLRGTERRKWVRSKAARYLPFGVATWIGLATNIQTLRHLFLQRANPAASPEFRDLAMQMYRQIQPYLPNLFQDFLEEHDEEGNPVLTQAPGALLRSTVDRTTKP